MIEIKSDLNPDYKEYGDKARPYFSIHNPDLDSLKDLKQDFKNLIVIGNGGSITSLRALNYAFRDQHDKNLEIVSTMEPGYLRHIEASVEKENTIVMPISKSGSTTGVIESTLYFLNSGYEVIPLTTNQESPLREIAQEKGLETIEHPDIGGRFTGLSETALAPAAMLGLDIEEIFKGGREMHEKLSPGAPNKASKLAQDLYEAEKIGFSEVLTPFYSTRLFGFYPLLVQLMHESVCKNGEGQTFFGDIGPEYQHHTNQRLFGGKENILPLFVEASHEHAEIDIDKNLSDIDIRGRKLGELDELSYEEALNSEAEGVQEALRQSSKPFIQLKLKEFNYRSVGGLMAFLQYLAVYSAWERDVNPFNQPDVEMSKDIGFKKRFEK